MDLQQLKFFIENIFDHDGSFAVAYASVLALINIRNMHLSDRARKLSNYLIEERRLQQLSKLIVAAKKYQISEFTKRYKMTGNASLVMILIIPVYLFSKIIYDSSDSYSIIFSFITLLASILLFCISILILIIDLVNGKWTLQANNMIIGINSEKDNDEILNRIDAFLEEE